MKQHKISYTFWWKALPVIALAVWGALCVSPNLWYDEAYSAALVSRSWFDMIYITALDAHSPFYYGMLKLFAYLGGHTHFQILKLMSLLFMMGYLLLGKYYVKKLFGEKVSVYFQFFSVTMPIMAVQAGNVRMYAAALFFMTLAGLTACDLFQNPEQERRKWKWFVFWGAGVCTVCCHTFAMIQMVWIYVLFLAAILLKKKYQLIKPYFIAGFGVALTFSPWLVVTFLQMRLRMANDVAPGQSEATPTIYTLIDYCKEWFSAIETPIAAVMFFGMGLTIFLGYYAVDAMRREKRYEVGLGIGAIGLTTLTGALVSYYATPCFLGRYAFPGFGSLALLYAVGMAEISSRKIKTVVIAAVILFFGLQYRSELELEYDPGLAVYETFLEEEVKSEDAFLGPYGHTLFLSVYHPQLQYYVYGYKSNSLPFVNTEAFTDWSQLENREGKVWYICFEGATPSEMEERYTWQEALSFRYMYYDFVIYELIHR